MTVVLLRLSSKYRQITVATVELPFTPRHCGRFLLPSRPFTRYVATEQLYSLIAGIFHYTPTIAMAAVLPH